MMYDGPLRPWSGVLLPLGVSVMVDHKKVAAIVRQIDLFKKSEYLSVAQKESAIAACQRDLAELYGQGSLSLESSSAAVQAAQGASQKASR